MNTTFKIFIESPPCNIGDTVYAVIDDILDIGEEPYIEEYLVCGIACLKNAGYVLNEDCELFEIGSDLCLLTKRAAELRLSEILSNRGGSDKEKI